MTDPIIHSLDLTGSFPFRISMLPARFTVRTGSGQAT